MSVVSPEGRTRCVYLWLVESFRVQDSRFLGGFILVPCSVFELTKEKRTNAFTSALACGLLLSCAFMSLHLADERLRQHNISLNHHLMHNSPERECIQQFDTVCWITPIQLLAAVRLRADFRKKINNNGCEGVLEQFSALLSRPDKNNDCERGCEMQWRSKARPQPGTLQLCGMFTDHSMTG